MPLDLQPVAPALDLRPVAAMTPGNADKMRQLYPDVPEEGKAPKLDLQPAALDLKPIAKAGKPSLLEAGMKGAYAPFEPIVRRFKDAATEIGAAESETPSPVRIENPRTGRPMNPSMDVTKPLRIIGGLGMATPQAVLAGAGGEAAETTAARAAGVPEAKAKQLGQDTGDLLALAAVPASKETLASERIASAAKINTDGKVLTGAKHADIPGDGKEGFVTSKGRFVTREQADKIAKANKQLVQPETQPGKLHSEDIGRPSALQVLHRPPTEEGGRHVFELYKNGKLAGRVTGWPDGKNFKVDLVENTSGEKLNNAEWKSVLPEVRKQFPETKTLTATRQSSGNTAKQRPVNVSLDKPYQSKIFSSDQPIASTKPVTSVQGVADKLYQHRNAMRADYKEFATWAKQFKGVPETFWQKALDHLDDPKNVTLSPQEQIIFDRAIKPMQEEIEANRAYVKKSGLDPNKLEEESGSLGGAIRVRKGMNTPLDRLTGTKSKPPEGGRSVSRSAGTFKGRNMMALLKDGKRTIVHIDPDGQIFDAAKRGDPIGQVNTDTGQPETGGKIVDATRKEIEQATGGKVAYHDNAFGVYGTTLLQTRRAARSVKLLNEIKTSPDFKMVARAPFSKGEVPKAWREINGVPEFRGWRFEPRYAEEIEDFVKGMKRDQGALSKLDKLNRFSLGSLFWLNPIHAYNITDAFLVTKGLGNLAKDLPGTVGDLLKSIKSIATRDKYNMAQTRSGIPMPGLDTAGEEFRRMTLNVMGVKARQDPQNFLRFIAQFGFKTPMEFFKRVSDISHKAVFSWQDVLQQTLERGYMRKGLSQAEATERVAKTFMNYRTPARVMDQRWIGQALQGQAWLDFPKYAYGRLQGLSNILKGSAKLDPHSIDQLLTIAILYEFGQHALNPLIQKYTGNSNAEAGNFGYTVFPDLAAKTMEGKRTPGQDLQSVLSLGYLPQAMFMGAGVNPYTSKPISIPGETAKEVGMDYASEAANKFSPMQRFGQMARGNVTPDELWLEQLGVKFPGDLPKSVQRSLRARERYGSPLEQEFGQ